MMISTHTGIYKWLQGKGFIGKNADKSVVDRLVNEYKRTTGNEFRQMTFYPGTCRGKRWDLSQQQFRSFTRWYLENKSQTIYNIC